MQATLALSAVACGRTGVQVAFLDDGIVALRNPKNVDPVPPHLFTDAEFDAYVAGILRGELVQLPRDSANPGHLGLADTAVAVAVCLETGWERTRRVRAADADQSSCRDT